MQFGEGSVVVSEQKRHVKFARCGYAACFSDVDATRFEVIALDIDNGDCIFGIKNGCCACSVQIVVFSRLLKLFYNGCRRDNVELPEDVVENVADSKGDECARVGNEHLEISKFVGDFLATIENVLRRTDCFSVLAADDLREFFELDLPVEI